MAIAIWFVMRTIHVRVVSWGWNVFVAAYLLPQMWHVLRKENREKIQSHPKMGEWLMRKESPEKTDRADRMALWVERHLL
jgi:hypothetical protein